MNKSKNILIAADNSDDQQLISLLFRKSQFSFLLTFAASFKEAQQEIQKGKFDIIVISDHRSLISDIRSSSSSKCVIIMICDELTEAEKGKQDGANIAFTKDILTKPLRFNEDLDLIPAKVRV